MYPNLTIAKNKRATTHLSKQMICFYTTKIKKFSLFPFCTLAIRNLFFSYFKFDLFSSLRKKASFGYNFLYFSSQIFISSTHAELNYASQAHLNHPVGKFSLHESQEEHVLFIYVFFPLIFCLMVAKRFVVHDLFKQLSVEVVKKMCSKQLYDFKLQFFCSYQSECVAFTIYCWFLLHTWPKETGA